MAGFSSKFQRLDLRLQLPMTPWLLPLQKFDKQNMWQLKGRDREVMDGMAPKFFGAVTVRIYPPVTYPTLGRG